jgi:hypothetical protein
LLDRYHAALVAHGVCGYDRAALDNDYRLSALWQITTPVWQAANNIPPVIWWNNLERILLAVEDLGCRDLLVWRRSTKRANFGFLRNNSAPQLARPGRALASQRGG